MFAVLKTKVMASRKSTGVINTIGSPYLVLKCPNKPWQCASEPAGTNGIQQLFVLLFTPVLLLL